MEALSPESNVAALEDKVAALEAKNQHLHEEVDQLSLQLEDVGIALEQYQSRVEWLAEKMVEYRDLWKNECRENELLKREVPSDADYPCYSQSRPEEGSSPYHKYNQLE